MAEARLPRWRSGEEAAAFHQYGLAAHDAGLAVCRVYRGRPDSAVVPAWVRSVLDNHDPCGEELRASLAAKLRSLDPEVAEAEWRLTGEVTL